MRLYETNLVPAVNTSVGCCVYPNKPRVKEEIKYANKESSVWYAIESFNVHNSPFKSNYKCETFICFKPSLAWLASMPH